MMPDKLRDYAIAIAAILFAISTAYTLYQMSPYYTPPVYTPSQNTGFQEINAYPNCLQSPTDSGKYSVTIDIQNTGMTEIKDISCSIVDTGGLQSENNQQAIASLPPQSTDVCYFILTGTVTSPLKFEVKYGNTTLRNICTF
jgi:hypothetical protein